MYREWIPGRHGVFIRPRSRRERKPVVEVLDSMGCRTRRCTVLQGGRVQVLWELGDSECLNALPSGLLVPLIDIDTTDRA